MKLQRFIKKYLNGIIIASGVLVTIGLLSEYIFHQELVAVSTMIIASIIGAFPIMVQAFQSLKNKVISIELLVSIAVIGAFFIQEYHESAIVTFLFLFGAYLERRTIQKTRDSVKSLIAMAPTTALILDDNGETEEVEIDFVDEGDRLLVKTGAQVPVDGFVLFGEGFIDEASVTGESFPVKKKLGDKVFAGTILTNGTLQIEAEKVGEDTTFGKIIELVEEAQDSKSAMEKFINKFSKYYTPAVIIFALVTYLFTRDIRLAITVLVLGCPGALVIGVPVSNVTGIGNGAKNGVLIKGGEVLDRMNQVDTMVFDKTGTLTEGKMAVTTFSVVGQEDPLGKAYLAAIEKESDHPLAQAIVSYLGETKSFMVEQSRTVEGRGIQGIVDKKEVLIGNERLLKEKEVAISHSEAKKIDAIKSQGNSIVLVAIEGKLQFIIGVSDVIRPEAKEALARLRKMGIKRFVMLTGDHTVTAQAVAKQLGIDEVHAELLPEDKVREVQKLKDTGHVVAFIGDGINDSPSIALADIGIAMGSGTDVAVETSDIVLMRSSFEELVHAYGLTKATIRNMRQNILIALATVAFLFIGLFAGFIYMASGMFVHEASILIVIFNGLRLVKYNQK
ncbi:MAG TPA: cation-translocating P-type ATPase [Candidatus Enterococcus avicola]|uniref:Cd(2+)-exporting ATPase n=1 Tax=Candidatus Enterococcus avicola TaxID=2838561 RepID=A0A9D2JJW9_9ENTE|nr:cation-translocating P-type ATPase [Candidatus Enterococcus avicola]